MTGMKAPESSRAISDGSICVDVADLADVDQVARVVLVFQHQLLRTDETAILAGQADGLAALLVDQVDDFLVHLAAEHHLDDFHGFRIGDAHALDELALLADAGEQVLDLRPAAVHDDDVEADQLEQHDVAREALLQVLVGHRVAAVLDDDGLAVETLDVGQGFGQDGGLDVGGEVVDAHGGLRGESPRIVQRKGPERVPALACASLRRVLSRWPDACSGWRRAWAASVRERLH